MLENDWDISVCKDQALAVQFTLIWCRLRGQRNIDYCNKEKHANDGKKEVCTDAFSKEEGYTTEIICGLPFVLEKPQLRRKLSRQQEWQYAQKSLLILINLKKIFN